MDKSNLKDLFQSTLLLAAFAVISAGLSLGLVADWNILDHLAMVDRFRAGGNLYSGMADFPSMASSNYFPGLSYIIIGLMQLTPDSFIIEAMHGLGIIFLIGFFIVQFFIIKDFVKTDVVQFTALWIFTTLLILNNWYFYALKFKPDTLALLIGLGALYVLQKYDQPERQNLFVVVISSVILALPLVLKQQYIAFIAGYIVYALFRRRVTSALSAVIVASIATLVISHVRSVENAWFWSVTVLADDGLNNFMIWGYEHFKLSIHLVTVSIILLWVAGLKSLHPLARPIRFIIDDMQLLRRPWAIPLIFASGASFLSGFKSGGNVGNTELAIILLFPFIFMIFKGIDRNISVAIACVALMISTADAFRGIKSYQQFGQAEAFFNGLEHSKTENVFTTSDYYAVVRNQRNKTGIHNWHHEILINKVGDDDLPAFIHNRNFAYVVLPAFSPINAELEKGFGYEPVYQNNQLMILKKDGGV